MDLPAEPDQVVTPELPAGDVWTRMAALFDHVADAVARAVRRGERPVVVSGDCSTALGTVAGLQRAGSDPAVVWFDAHGDVQTVETSASGYPGGMPLRMLAGYGGHLIADRIRLRALPEERLLLVDGRDLDPPEVDYLARSAVRRCEVAALAEPGGADCLPDGPLYLHIDVDVIDPADLPGLLYPVPGGPATTTVAEAVRRIAATGRVAAVGVACTWAPGHDNGARVRPVFEPLLTGPPARRLVAET